MTRYLVWHQDGDWHRAVLPPTWRQRSWFTAKELTEYLNSAHNRDQEFQVVTIDDSEADRPGLMTL